MTNVSVAFTKVLNGALMHILIFEKTLNSRKILKTITDFCVFFVLRSDGHHLTEGFI